MNNPNIQKMQLMMNYPSVQRIQQIFNNYPKINEFREKVYYSNLNIQFGLYNIQVPTQIINSQLQIIKKLFRSLFKNIQLEQYYKFGYWYL